MTPVWEPLQKAQPLSADTQAAMSSRYPGLSWESPRIRFSAKSCSGAASSAFQYGYSISE